MFITKKHISRRTVLKGLGAGLGASILATAVLCIGGLRLPILCPVLRVSVLRAAGLWLSVLRAVLRAAVLCVTGLRLSVLRAVLRISVLGRAVLLWVIGLRSPLLRTPRLGCPVLRASR